MQFLPALLTREESDALVDRIETHFRRHGFGPFALELQDVFIGFTGLFIPKFEAHFTPCVEIGWRLAPDYWNRGLAAEAAKKVLRYGLEDLRLEEIVSFTTEINLPSRRVMEKIGMVHNPADDFDHPELPDGHPLRRHVLYRIRRG